MQRLSNLFSAKNFLHARRVTKSTATMYNGKNFTHLHQAGAGNALNTQIFNQPKYDIEVKPELLSNRLCLVTNCNVSDDSAFPTKIAHSLARYGANVIIHSDCKDEAHELANELSRHLPNQQHHILISNDSSNVEQACNEMTDNLSELTNNLDVLICNSTNSNSSKDSVIDYSYNEFDNVVNSNLKTPFLLTQALLPFLTKGNDPSVVLSSSETEVNDKDNVDYYVNKFSSRSSAMLTSMLSEQLSSSNIRVNAVDPGRFFLFANDNLTELPEECDLTRAFVWLSRGDTIVTGEHIDAKDWINRDPSMFKKGY